MRISMFVSPRWSPGAGPLALSPLLLGACISSNPPLPAVRTFDPRPAVTDAGPRAGVTVALRAGAAVRTQFVLRTSATEVVVDDAHRWLAAPEELVGEWLQRELPAAASDPSVGPLPAVVRGLLRRFEFDLTGIPAAVVELDVQVAGESGDRWVPCRARVDAASTRAEDLAAAMAAAVAALGAQVARAVS